MCGIVGLFGEITPQLKGMFELMLCFDVARGTDGLGVLSVDTKNEWMINRSLNRPWTFINSNVEYNHEMEDEHILLLGHNRAGTVGATSIKNTHPFPYSNVIGVHNGTLKNKYVLPNKTTTVDSDALYSAINNEGIEHWYEKVNGSMSLVWWNIDDDTLNFIRNDERPMHLGRVGNTLVFASEKEMFLTAGSMVGLDVKYLGHTPVHTHMIMHKDDVFTAKRKVLKPFKTSTPVSSGIIRTLMTVTRVSTNNSKIKIYTLKGINNNQVWTCTNPKLNLTVGQTVTCTTTQYSSIAYNPIITYKKAG